MDHLPLLYILQTQTNQLLKTIHIVLGERDLRVQSAPSEVVLEHVPTKLKISWPKGVINLGKFGWVGWSQGVAIKTGSQFSLFKPLDSYNTEIKDDNKF